MSKSKSITCLLTLALSLSACKFEVSQIQDESLLSNGFSTGCSADPSTGKIGETISIRSHALVSGHSKADGSPNTILGESWTFGDGSDDNYKGGPSNPNHTYNSPGVYTIQLTTAAAIDTQVRYATATCTVTIVDPSYKPIASAVVTNNASGEERVAPGSIANLSGDNLAVTADDVKPTTGPNGKLIYPTQYAGTEVLVNGFPAQLLRLTPTLIKFLIPENIPAGTELTPTTVHVQVRYRGNVVAEQQALKVTKTSVGIYGANNPSNNKLEFLDAIVIYSDGGSEQYLKTVLSENSGLSIRHLLNPISASIIQNRPLLQIYTTGINGTDKIKTIKINGQDIET